MPETPFRRELERSPIDVPRAALYFAREIAYPDLDTGLYLALIDQLIKWAREVIPPAKSVPAQASVLGDLLFGRFGFQGNAADYTDPRNSFLNEVLDRRLGIPISLSVIYIAVAQGLGLEARGVGLPGHFIVSLQTEAGPLYLDPFHQGSILSIEDCAELVYRTTGYQGEFRTEWLEPAVPRQILVRMLANLRNTFVQRADWRNALATLEHLRVLEPDHPEHLLDLGLIHHQHGSLRRAASYYEQYLNRAGNQPGYEEVLKTFQAVTRRLAEMN
jgi:regulator of sirC expression with transglutaminase-like and TPR domain